MNNKFDAVFKIWLYFLQAIAFAGTLCWGYWIYIFLYCLSHPVETEIGGAIALMFLIGLSPALLLSTAGILELSKSRFSKRFYRVIEVWLFILLTFAGTYHVWRILCELMDPTAQEALPTFIMFLVMDLLVFTFLYPPIRWKIKQFK